jgi:UDP-N-acetylmuramoyl-tripeptide--D-alanyl-D-alanine ligase
MDVSHLYELYKQSSGVSIDSRTLQDRQMFFAIVGERYDGHQFVDQAIKDGASIIVISDESYSREGYTYMVDDTLKCLQDLANYHRRQFDVPVVAITGSNGKTTTKELIHAVLSEKYKVYTTRGNYNNHIGVPLTLLSAPIDSEILIIEMGANHMQEIDALCRIAAPNFGLITNIGQAHIEGFGSYENIIIGKTELYRYLSEVKGSIFYDDENKVLSQNLPANTDTIEYIVSDIEFYYNNPTLEFRDVDHEERYVTHLYGIYNQANIEAAITLGRYFKVFDDNIFSALASYVPSMNRSQIKKISGITYIMDAYNANPTSMKASIKSFMNFGKQKKCLILGDMKELGSDAIPLHRELLEYAQTYPWDKIVLVGPLFKQAAEGLDALCYTDVQELKQEYGQLIESWTDHTVLLKGSRSMKLELLLDS